MRVTSKVRYLSFPSLQRKLGQDRARSHVLKIYIYTEFRKILMSFDIIVRLNLDCLENEQQFIRIYSTNVVHYDPLAIVRP